MIPNTDTVTQLIRTIVAEEVVPRFEKLAHGDVTEKAPGDYVTIADIETERRLTEELTRLLPGSVVVGEEAAAADPAILGLLAHAAPVWVIDPVDGTWNFSEGRRYFGTMVALVRRDASRPPGSTTRLAATRRWRRPGAGAWLGDRRLLRVAIRSARRSCAARCSPASSATRRSAPASRRAAARSGR